MAEERVQRRLAAILAMDVVGYSRLMAVDETGTLAQLKAIRKELIDPTVAKWHGRSVKTTGDGELVEFASAVDAMQQAAEVQRAMMQRNENVSHEKRIEFRVGINVGDIIVEDEDIFGDGVNIAARMEGLAGAGGVCISGTAFDQVKAKLDFGFEDLGPRTVKNIPVPVRCYRVMLDPDAAGKFVEAPTREMRDRPSVAVLPFVNMSGDPEQEYFSDGITEDIITDLSNVSALFIISRNSTFAYKGQSPDIRKVGQELGVRHVLEGSVRKSGGNVRINAQLIDAPSGGHIWAERYDGKLEDIFALQDEITAKIVSALKVKLTTAENVRAERKMTTSVDAYDLYLRGRAKFYHFTPPSHVEAEHLFNQSLEIDPDFAAVYAALSFGYVIDMLFQWGARDDAMDRALAAAEKAVEIDDALGFAHSRLGWVQLFLGQHDEAVASFERALALDPDDPDTCAFFAETLNFTGDPQRAIVLMEQAFEHDPLMPPHTAYHLGHSYYLLRRYDDALRLLRQATERAPTFPVARVYLAAVFSELDRMDDATAEVDAVLKLVPHWTLGFVGEKMLNYRSEADLSRWIEALRRAGLPE
ncbi:MAG: tetratricopeptide repeat protein [Planctomycetota bacterium]|nr:tetratricopeptide repeat protein [Planctomycetota bacterium]